MKAHKPTDVLARVVAWHNRHPLAKRIKASQVSGIGEVRLPFASDRAAEAEPPPALPVSLPVLTEVLPQALANEVPADEWLAAERAYATDLPVAPAVAPPVAPKPIPEPVVAASIPAPEADDDTEPEFVMASEPAPAADLKAPANAPVPAADESESDVLEAALNEHERERDTAPPTASPSPAPAPDSLATRLQAARAAALLAEGAAAGTDAQTSVAAPAQPPMGALRAKAHASAANADNASTGTSLSWWRRLFKRARRPHAGQLRPLFSQQFIWPISPAKVARWAKKHGAASQVAPADWPFRQIKAEPTLVAKTRAKGLSHRVQLHVMTAAIGVQDRRMRVLLDSEGHVLGPRAYDRNRVSMALGMLVLGLGGLAFQALRPVPHSDPSTQMAAAAPSAASAAIQDEQTASAPDAAENALPLHTQAVVLPLAAASATHSTAPDGGLDKATVAAAGMVSGPPASPRRDLAAVFAPPSKPGPDGHAAAQNPLQMPPPPVHQPNLAHAPTAATGAVAATAADIAASNAAWARASGLFAPERAASAAAAPRLTDGSTARASPPLAKADASIVTTTPPPSFPERRASGPVAQIRPELSEQQRQQARDSSQAARQATSSQAETAQRRTGAQDSPRFAVVAEGSGQRDLAEARLAQMKSVRAQIPAPAPAHSELVQQQGLWHAALWPFGSPAEAERARVMLGTRGLKAEVVSF